MSCRKYKKMLFLDRPGELSPGEQKELQRHLLTCAACTKLQEKIENDKAIIERLRQTAANVPNAPQLTDDILAGIRLQRRATNIPKKHRTDIISARLTLPRLRFILTTFVILILAAFLGQEVMILGRISKLEKQLADKPTVQSHDIQESAVLKSFLKNLNQLDLVKDDKILVNKKSLETLLKSYGELKMSNRILLQYLQDHKAEIEGFYEKSINPDQIEKVLKKDKRFRQLIRES